MIRLLPDWATWVVLISNLSGQPQTTHLFSLDASGSSMVSPGRRLLAEVGDTTASGFSPTLALSAWDGRVCMEVDLSAGQAVATNSWRVLRDDLGTEKVKIETSSLIHELFQLGSTGLEWMIIINKLPDSNTLVFPLSVSGLTFHYQDSLNDYERDSLWCRRPDSVIGSYAVYRDFERGHEGAFGYTDKAFHIFRPRAWDRRGDTVWCELEIDTVARTLSISLPVAFAETAEYPVTVDPTFGSTAAGASGLYLGPGHVRHCRFQMGPATGLADSITCYVQYDGIVDSLGVALYDDSVANPAALLTQCTNRQVSESWSTQWYSFALAERVELDAASYYWLSFLAAASAYLRYDDLGAGVSEGHFADPWPPADPASRDWNALDYTFSVYCTYSTATTPESVGRRRRLCGGN